MKHGHTHIDYHNKGFDGGSLFSSKPNFDKAEFDGVTYEPKFDATRLRGEMARVYELMNNTRGHWWTLSDISNTIHAPEASISARLRDLRKAKFGSHTVNRRRSGDPKRGLFEYQLL